MQSKCLQSLRDEIYNAFVNDPRVNQALDPWRLESRSSSYTYNPNKWKNIVADQGRTIAEVNAMTKEELRRFRETLNQKERPQFDHRHHLHITIFDYYHLTLADY